MGFVLSIYRGAAESAGRNLTGGDVNDQYIDFNINMLSSMPCGKGTTQNKDLYLLTIYDGISIAEKGQLTWRSESN